jgi:transcriptional regulator with XRE-family HTH domain
MLNQASLSSRPDTRPLGSGKIKTDLSSEVASNRSPTSADVGVGRRIKELRRNRGLSQKQVAWSIGVTGAQFHRYEAGATRVATSRLMAIAETLGVPPHRLMSEAAPISNVAQPAGDNPEARQSNDLVELMELFSLVADQRRRAAMMTFAKSLASAPEVAENLDDG